MREKISNLLDDHPYLLIERQANFSWLFKGRGHINLASEKACGSLVISKDKIALISNNIELHRLLNEESAVELEGYEFPWYEAQKRDDIICNLTNGETIRDDTQLEAEFKKQRTKLGQQEIVDYQLSSRLVAEAVEAVCFSIRQGMTEFEIAGKVAKEMYTFGLEPVVTLVGSDGRLNEVRHFLPTRKALERKVIISVVGRYKGLMSSVTRTVYFGNPTEDEVRRMKAVQYIDAYLIASTTKGESFSSLFNKVKGWYKESGFESEWQNHHQGGMTGYLPREELAMDTSSFVIDDCQAYAWNPSVPGAKSEDTTLIKDNETKILSLTGNFPTTEIVINGKKISRTTYIKRTKAF